MDQPKSSFWQRRLLTCIVVSIALTLISGAVFADMRIRIGEEDASQEIFMKNARIRMPEPDMDLLFDCKAGNVALLASKVKRYWQGTVQDFRDEVNALFTMMLESDQPVDIFSTKAKPVTVRTTRSGTDTIAGYDAIHYVIEYQEGGTWNHFEDVWVAPALLKEIEAENAECINTLVQDFTFTMMQMNLGDRLEDEPMWSVITSPEYLALSKEGFVVRNLSVVDMFGMQIETLSELKEVSRDSLDDALFVIPDDYGPMTLLEAIS